MSGIVHKTKGIVLRTVKYGETSLIVTIFTELLGLQSYMVNSVRILSKKGQYKAGIFQPAAILSLEVYHNELKNLNRIKECKWEYIYQHIFTDVIKNGIAMYMVELMGKCLRQPEANEDLFAFAEDCFLFLDVSTNKEMANFPIFFAINLTNFFGSALRHECAIAGSNLIFDIQEGTFTTEMPAHHFYLQPKYTSVLADLLRVQHPSELSQVETNSDTRRQILDSLEIYYALHIQDFGKLKTLPVLREIMR